MRIYLDVDGVVNAVTRKQTDLAASGWPLDSFKTKKIYGYPITWSTLLVDALNALSSHDDVEIRWLTTWGSIARSNLAPGVGLLGEEWAYVTDGVHTIGAMGNVSMASGYGGWWKLEAIQRDLADLPENEPVVWIDDDIKKIAAALSWAGIRPNVTVISPWTTRGLTPSDIDAILLLATNQGAVGERISG